MQLVSLQYIHIHIQISSEKLFDDLNNNTIYIVMQINLAQTCICPYICLCNIYTFLMWKLSQVSIIEVSKHYNYVCFLNPPFHGNIFFSQIYAKPLIYNKLQRIHTKFHLYVKIIKIYVSYVQIRVDQQSSDCSPLKSLTPENFVCFSYVCIFLQKWK